MTHAAQLAADITRMRAEIRRLGSRTPRWLREDLAAAVREQGIPARPQAPAPYPCATHGEW
jgi:hypothetical protein